MWQIVKHAAVNMYAQLVTMAFMFSTKLAPHARAIVNRAPATPFALHVTLAFS
jgi:hypothetical protein